MIWAKPNTLSLRLDHSHHEFNIKYLGRFMRNNGIGLNLAVRLLLKARKVEFSPILASPLSRSLTDSKAMWIQCFGLM